MNRHFNIIATLILFIFIKSFILEPNSLTATNYIINSSYLRGMKVAFISDTHLKKGSTKRINQIFKITAEQKPDIIILGGDIVAKSRKGKIPNISLLVQKLKLLGCPILAVLGESDIETDPAKIAAELRKNGVVVLDSSSRTIRLYGRYIDIIGLPSLKEENVDISKAFRGTSRPRIVVTHSPDTYFNIIDDVDLILAGHTHGGQFVLPFSPPLIVDSKFGAEFGSGLIEKTKNPMIISKGVGTKGIPARLNCTPEIIIVTFN